MSEKIAVHAPKKIIDVYIIDGNLCIRMDGDNKKMYRAEISNGDSSYALVNSLRKLADDIITNEVK